MDINENAPGNISQHGIGATTDNETAHGPKGDGREATLPQRPHFAAGEPGSDEGAYDSTEEEDDGEDTIGNEGGEFPGQPANPPVDEDEEPSPGNH
ncbi:hypothetical protein [Pseudomonas eucalypticola]|uniref:Uncharacterized protein n=1 Tax=Pseudomonas eucalypticola TaxID=2599595 RepID=A0A7D5D7I5_9PSED|nr:hypothetical protein [Pseudomonas eucalypticola]QKZ05434.1 hypothetical protein HWQ56_17175 [Pseudomonas eucalypticola]